jgi:hypothetical protein
LSANSHPRVVAVKRQPSATIGVPVMSPSPPALDAENVQAGVSSGTSAGEITRSRSWWRLLARSWP